MPSDAKNVAIWRCTPCVIELVTDGVLDRNGAKVKASKQFRHLRTDVASWYRDLLLQAIAAAAGGHRTATVQK